MPGKMEFLRKLLIVMSFIARGQNEEHFMGARSLRVGHSISIACNAREMNISTTEIYSAGLLKGSEHMASVGREAGNPDVFIEKIEKYLNKGWVFNILPKEEIEEAPQNNTRKVMAVKATKNGVVRSDAGNYTCKIETDVEVNKFTFEYTIF